MGAFNFSVGYAAGDVETNAGVKVSETSGVGLGATYSLSKRTTLYAGLKNTKTENAAGAKTAGTRLYAAGVRHNF
jgi:predicted porin